MPKLHGYTERQYLNIYDCASPRDFLEDGRARLFGSKNIGTLTKTNVVSPNEITHDQTAIVGNWYARTNIDRSIPQFVQWAHTATASLIVGMMPVAQRPIYELLQAKQGDNMAFDQTFALSAADHDARRDYLAKVAFEVLRPGELKVCALGYGGDFDSAPDYAKNRLAGIVDNVSHRLGRGGIHVVIPVRQLYSVRIDADPMATRSLLEVMPPVSPQSLVWVHIEGVQARFTA
jgi:hypothetical protein